MIPQLLPAQPWNQASQGRMVPQDPSAGLDALGLPAWGLGSGGVLGSGSAGDGSCHTIIHSLLGT